MLIELITSTAGGISQPFFGFVSECGRGHFDVLLLCHFLTSAQHSAEWPEAEGNPGSIHIIEDVKS